MTRDCWGGSIRVRLSRLRTVFAAAACAVIASGQDVAKLARAFADNPNAANRKELVAYAAAHKNASGAIAALAIGAADAQGDNKKEAVRYLRIARERLPKVAD